MLKRRLEAATASCSDQSEGMKRSSTSASRVLFKRSPKLHSVQE
jgi:hypothetical protein